MRAAFTARRPEGGREGRTGAGQGRLTLFVAGHQDSGSVPGHGRVRQQHVQELRHVSHLFLEDGAVHHKHDPSGGGGRSRQGKRGCVAVTSNGWGNSARAAWLSPGGRLELLQVLVTKAVVSRQIDQGPGAALDKSRPGQTRHQLSTKDMRAGDKPTRSPLTLYGALLSVMEVWVRLNLPDSSCRTSNASASALTLTLTLQTPHLRLLTRVNRRVLPESHSPTRRTALLTVLLLRKYFRNTGKRDAVTPVCCRRRGLHRGFERNLASRF